VDEQGIKLTSYLGERRRIDGRLAADALVELYGRQEIAASIALRGTEGFGLRHHIRTNHSLTMSDSLPLTAIAVDTSPRIRAVLDETRRINHRGLITLERTRFLSEEINPVVLTQTADNEATRLTVYFGRQDTVFMVPAFEVMCELLHRRSIGGATALAGVDGNNHGHRQRGHFFSRNANVPMVVVAVGACESIGPVLPEIGGLLRSPRMTLDRVQICKRDGELVSEPEMPPPYDEDGLACWQKLTVYASQATQHNGQPIHRSLIRRLLAAGVSGATTQPGLWGFHGQHAPHGSDHHLLQFDHHVPAVTVVIEAPQRVPIAFGVIDELTTDHGLVTCERVPVIVPAAPEEPGWELPGRTT
jgi:PII-like signaling protein